jgi:hypothetical protein
MLRFLGVAAVGFLFGVGAVLVMDRTREPAWSGIHGLDESAPVMQSTDSRDSLQTLRVEMEARLADLDHRLGELADEMRALVTQGSIATLGTERLAPPDPEALARRLAEMGSIVDSIESSRDIAARNDQERLYAAGFTPERVEWIERRRQALQMDESMHRYQAMRGDVPEDTNPLWGMIGPELALRSEMGEDEYDRYREALGQPTAVTVGRVLANSPAEQAGLRSTDEIVAYDGRRVYSPFEIDVLALEGNVGEAVIVDIRRDGQIMQLVLPRGPTGISGTSRDRLEHILMR